MSEQQPKTLGVVLFPEFELLDLFGPAEMFGNLKGWVNIVTVAEQAGSVASAQDVRVVADYGFGNCPHLDLILVPGGIGTRAEVDNEFMLSFLRKRVAEAEVA